MNVHRPAMLRVESEISPDGLVTLPESIRRASGLVPGRPVVVALNDRGEVVILTRTQARRHGETPAERAKRLNEAFDAIGTSFATGQSTDEIMMELRGPRDT